MSSNGVTRDTRASEESEAPGIEGRPDPREGGTEAAARRGRARRTLDRHAATVERRALRRALRRLEEQGGLSPAQRAVLERFVERLGEGVLAGPRAALAADGDATRPADDDWSRDVDGDWSRDVDEDSSCDVDGDTSRTDGGDETESGAEDRRVDTAAVVERLFDRQTADSDGRSEG